jgi:uncharacterized membrane protein
VKHHHVLFIALLVGLLILISAATSAYAQHSTPVVHAVLFYSPACGHCHFVITETLPPLFEKYGDQLQIIGVDVTTPRGQALFQAALQKFNLEAGGVPFLVVGDAYLVGSLDIPEQFPGLIEYYLRLGGVDWPEIPGLTAEITGSAGTAEGETTPSTQPTADASISQPTAHPVTPEPAATSQTSSQSTETLNTGLNNTQDPNWRDRFSQDPAGNALALLVFAGMLGSVMWTGQRFRTRAGASFKDGWAWAIPALCLIGFCVAGYLAYVETTQGTAVCGPVGDCNTVQQSEYARLFGILPIGILGLAGYVMIFLAWLVARYASGRIMDLAAISLFIMTVLGTLFSMYLTWLEPFVIGATCAWCLTSAILMTTLMLLSVGPAMLAFSRYSPKNILHRKHI